VLFQTANLEKKIQFTILKVLFFSIVFFSFLLIYAFFVFFSFTIHLLDFCVVYLHY